MDTPASDRESIRARLFAVRQRIAQAEQRYGRARGGGSCASCDVHGSTSVAGGMDVGSDRSPHLGILPGEVALLAVSKACPVSAIRAAHEEGQMLFGESYLQEALPKIEALYGQGIEWHFIGPLQSNKTRQIAQHFAWVHGVDRELIAQRLSAQRFPSLPPLNICLQVKVGGEAQKAGVDVHDREALQRLASRVAALPHIKLRGLMAIPAPMQDFDDQRRAFSVVREAFEKLNRDGFGLDTLSMGMSNDMEAAIAEGATLVRIGSAIFGERK